MSAVVSAPVNHWAIRPLTAADVDSLLHIQSQAYAAQLHESRAVFARRLAVGHQCSLGVERPGESGLLAYAAAYWSAVGRITALNGDFEPPPPQAAPALYLHDISVLPALAGQKVAHALIVRLMELARSRAVAHMALVAVQGSGRFWQRYGFAEQKVTTPAEQQHLDSYGPGALYMARRL